ncbi:UDP-N-acetylmuramate--L-alanine ligase [Spiractinospora alimapuensis]|uniref:UDP-N-acetylmuramate--L-alanine ligase n=1 Tax=Spiractinospora alimapuensis TaxID=2820884 RepID=UPI001EEB90D4|nr:UDP-N-acetylmuramate--L-alanine ligase [Spiractinospora alimapuensis]QVQ53130.1 UDP-N-acetylmuramate--L-alanine ligase [Spiractinospora alimapuensis]
MSLVERTEVPPTTELGHVHFVGIGGAGMSGIARVLLRQGVPVSGSDAREGPALPELRAAGATVHVGHTAENLGDADTLVVSSAIRDDNPELAAARERGLRVLPRAAALGGLLLSRRGVTVAGTHGKTTTSSMLTVILRELGADPGYVIGGTLTATGTGAEAGTGEVMVVEADESDGSFLLLSPAVSVITNIEADHLDNHAGLAEIRALFAQFAARTTELIVVSADDPETVALTADLHHPTADVVTFGRSASADYVVDDVRAEGFATRFTLRAPDGERVDCRVEAAGEHNALNAAAAVATAHRLGHDLEAAARAAAAFTGSGRRMEPKGGGRGVRVYDSYAHHPTEVAADLRAVRAALDSTGADTAGGERHPRVLVVFQPHLFSRTRAFAAEFAAALALADTALVLPIYPAREDPIPGVDARLITDGPDTDGRVLGHLERETVAKRVAELARPGDVVLTMGAGDVTELGPDIAAALNEA